MYCFPHAGATASIYRPWQAVSAAGTSIVGVDPPGRGTRARDRRAGEYRALVRSMAERVIADLIRYPHLPYVTFGHSFGAMVSLAVAAEVARVTGRPPVRAVLSAALPPRLQRDRADSVEGLSDEELLDRMVKDGATAPELLEHRALAAHLVRLMREDYAVRREFVDDSALRVDFPLVLIAASEDGYITPEQMWHWAEHSTAGARRVEIEGDHFAAIRVPAEIIGIATEGVS